MARGQRHMVRGRGATGSRGSIDPHFSGAGSTYGAWPLTFCPVFPLSRPVNPKHNPCTCRMMFRCCPAMAREQILTESINLSTMELWNSLPDNLRHLDLSLGQFRWALKTHLFWRSLRRIYNDLYFSAPTINLLTYLLYKRSISDNTSFRAKL